MDARGVSDDAEPLAGARVVSEQSVPMRHSLSRSEVLHVSELERVVRLARHHVGSSLRVSPVHPSASFLPRVVNLRAARSRSALPATTSKFFVVTMTWDHSPNREQVV